MVGADGVEGVSEGGRWVGGEICGEGVGGGVYCVVDRLVVLGRSLGRG
jgi:hypothetical protein